MIEEGTFKYVLIALSHRPSGAGKLIVRGSCSCGYHDDVLHAARREISQKFGSDVQVRCSCLLRGVHTVFSTGCRGLHVRVLWPLAAGPSSSVKRDHRRCPMVQVML